LRVADRLWEDADRLWQAAETVQGLGGVRYTVKDGILYDARQLLADVRRMVEEAKKTSGKGIVQPGMETP